MRGVFALLSLMAISNAFAAEEAHVFKPYSRAIITWVPPYGTARTKTRVREEAGADSLTHIGLQFWTPSPEGGVRRVSHYDKLPDSLIADWRDWCHAHGMRALLCVYNGEEKWDWPLAQAG